MKQRAIPKGIFLVQLAASHSTLMYLPLNVAYAVLKKRFKPLPALACMHHKR
jgi:hypothetical protein